MIECTPTPVYATEVEVKVPVQLMLNKTVERLCEAVAIDWSQEALNDVTFLLTSGFDSSSGHTNSHQRCENPENDSPNAQQSLFVTSILLINVRYHSFLNYETKKIFQFSLL